MFYRLKTHIGIPLILVMAVACHKAEPWADSEFDERLSAGTQTVFTEGVGAFSEGFPGLTGRRADLHELGDVHFEATFIAAPAPKFPGLGTVYNSNSCFNCHINDGRGKPISSFEPLASMLFRVSVPGVGDHGGPLGAPGFGGQLQDKAVLAHLPEAHVSVQWIETPVVFADGEVIMLREPQWTFTDSYLPLPAGWLYSARIAPTLQGLGLLEQISESSILAYSDEFDLNGDGISGKPNYVWDEKRQTMMLGRFGWKAEAPTLDQQVAGAYNEDMGITSYILPRESSYGQTQDDGLNDDPEVPDSIFNAVVFYVRTLAVPARRKVTDPVVQHGKQIFVEAQCGQCHIPVMQTKTDVTFPEASNQRIQPFTDLLLHDMGSGLADHRPTYNAGGTEWKTPALWGIGLTPLVNGHSFFLHDGRARNLMEAILWHGGEAEGAVNHVKQLSKSDREALIAFLKSL